MTYAIIKNAQIPMPMPKRGPKADAKYPFAQMEVGDGFDVPTSPPSAPYSVIANRVRSAASTWAKRAGVGAEFTVRQTDEGAVRCVRIA